MTPPLEGKRYPDASFLVDPGRVEAFSSLFGTVGGVPPTFATVAEFTVFPQVVEDPELALDLARVVHGSQAYDHHRPLVEGETLAVRTRLGAIRSKGGSRFVTIETELVGADGAVACTATSTMIERGEP